LGKKMLDLLSDPLTDGRQEQIVAAQFANGYRLELKDGMIISGEDGDRLLIKRLAHEAVRDRRLIETPNDQIDFTRRQQGQNLLGPAFHQTDIKIAVFDLQPAQYARQGADRHCRR
jgi:hypothetical protein